MRRLASAVSFGPPWLFSVQKPAADWHRPLHFACGIFTGLPYDLTIAERKCLYGAAFACPSMIALPPFTFDKEMSNETRFFRRSIRA